MDHAETLLNAGDRLSRRLSRLRFSAPVSHVYNPLVYARAPYAAYLHRYAEGHKELLVLGMNPGPFGMAQTGVPFGEIGMVRDWLGIEGPVGRPRREHPKRPITGFACTRSEVSGARLWGLWRKLYETPERFFAHAFVANYCPLVFMEESGRNLTPDKLRAQERSAVLGACDEHLATVIGTLRPTWVVGVGRFAEARMAALLESKALGTQIPRVATLPHPSPASPAANRDWAETALRELERQGVPL